MAIKIYADAGSNLFSGIIKKRNADITVVNMSLTIDEKTYQCYKDEIDVDKISGTSDMKKVKDLKGNPLLLFAHEWSIRMTLERNEGLELEEFSRN